MKRDTAVHLDPQTGTAIVLRAGQVLRISDPEGEHAADLLVFGVDDVGSGCPQGAPSTTTRRSISPSTRL